MEEQKQKLLPFIIGGSAVIIILVLVVVVLLSRDKKEAPQETHVPTTEDFAAKDTSVTAIKSASSKTGTTSKDLLQVIDKESVLRSSDGGDTFAPYFKIATTSTKNGFADVITINFHPSKKDNIIVTSYEDGLFNKTPENDAWDIIAFPPQKIYSFVLDKSNPDNKMFVSGVVDGNGRIFRTKDSGKTWKAVYVEPGSGSTITALAQDQRDPKIIYSGTSKGTIVKSIDGGDTWRNIGSKIDGLIRFISFDAIRPAAVYLLSFQKTMYYSGDKGETWIDWEKEKREEVSTLNTRANTLAKQGNSTGATELREQAKTLTERNAKNKMPNGINLIVPDPRVSGTIYAGNNGGLFKSTDFGKYWYELDIIESAHGFPVRSIAINPKNSKEIVFVAGKAFYKTQNGGSTWSVTPLSNDRDASFVAYNPFEVNTIFIGVSSI